MFHIREVKIDRIVLAKAIGICALGWLAVPLIYVLLKKKEVKNETIPDGGREDSISE
jgi:hypothetical protein